MEVWSPAAQAVELQSAPCRLRGHLQTFPKPKDMSALPSKAEIGGVTDSQAPELIAQGCEPPLLDLRRTDGALRKQSARARSDTAGRPHWRSALILGPKAKR